MHPPKITEASSDDRNRAEESKKGESTKMVKPPQIRKLINTDSIPSAGYHGTITSSLEKKSDPSPSSGGAT